MHLHVCVGQLGNVLKVTSSATKDKTAYSLKPQTEKPELAFLSVWLCQSTLLGEVLLECL